MSRYTDESKERVREAVDMVALVSTKTELRRAGVNSYFGRCPFHDERTPSFHVRPEEKHYYCFGCQASGDPFDFVMETEGLDFVGALESLADRFGVTLERADEDPEARARRERRERLHGLLDRAADYYARYLWATQEAAAARAYLARRGLAEATLRAFRVGFAPGAGEKLLAASRQAGYRDEELLATGLAQRSRRDGTLFDRFRGRIMFPLADARGRVVGFGARAMGDAQPKYLNTSEGEVFHKGSQLFGIDRARRAAARSGRVILAEGYTDVLALHQAGIENAVGLMGTALTDEQARELERTARTLVLALDADRAGQEAMLRAARIAAGRRLELRVVPLPEGADPADLIQRDGPEAVRALVGRSIPFVAFHVERILERADLGDAEGKDRALAELGPVLAPLPPSVLREELIRRVAARLDVPDELAAQLLERHAAEAAAAEAAAAGAPAGGAGAPAPGAARAAAGTPPAAAGGPGAGGAAGPPRPGGAATAARAALDRRARTEREFLALCIAFPAEGSAALARVDRDAHFTSDVARRAAAHLQDRLGAPLEGLPDDDPELSRYVQALLHGPEGVAPTRAGLERAWLMLELARLERAIEAARAAGAGVAQLSRDKMAVLAQLRALMEDDA